MKTYLVQINLTQHKGGLNYNSMLIKVTIIVLVESCKEKAHYIVLSNHIYLIVHPTLFTHAVDCCYINAKILRLFIFKPQNRTEVLKIAYLHSGQS